MNQQEILEAPQVAESPQAVENKPVKTLSSIERSIIQAQVIEQLRTCFDPEIPVNIYELGLIYSVEVSETGSVNVRMTLTSPHCPAAQSLPTDAANKARNVHGVTEAIIDVVWEPPWNPSLMSEAAKLELGMF